MSVLKDNIDQIINLFRAGSTQSQIAERFGVSGERVRQLLRAAGVNAQEGGQSARKAKRETARAAEREEACMDKHGCTLAQFFQANGARGMGSSSPYRAFCYQRNHARHRGIEWKMKFWEWYCVWKESGRLSERGRGANGYCMCRTGDQGAYEAGNVYIGTGTHNSTLGRTLAHERRIARNAFQRAMIAAGGRRLLSEALGVPVAYLAQLANSGNMPRCWLSDGRAQRFSDLTGGLFSLNDIAQLCLQSKREAA